MSAPGPVACPDCGALVLPAGSSAPVHAYLGASAGCWAAWGELQAAAYGDSAAGAFSPLAVDTYCAQHPGGHDRRAIQSAWVHLISICLVLEHGWTPQEAIRAKQVLLVGERTFVRLEPPVHAYPVTVLDVAQAGPAGYASAVRCWAEATWAAWTPHHDAIRARAAEIAERR